MRIKKIINLGYYLDITPNSRTSQQRNAWSSVRRISYQILGVKGLKGLVHGILGNSVHFHKL